MLIQLLVGLTLIKTKISLTGGSFKPGSVLRSGSPVVPIPAMLKGPLKGGVRLHNMALPSKSALDCAWVSWGLKKTGGIILGSQLD